MTDDRKTLSDTDLDRLLADAMDGLPAPGGARPGGWFGPLLAAVGGWAGAGGLATAGLVGIWLGVAPPSAVEAQALTVFDAFSGDLAGGWADYGDSL